jgi:NAD(P)-dependent dehydrogenase (short-subunit alcohol dehydrogenase family)
MMAQDSRVEHVADQQAAGDAKQRRSDGEVVVVIGVGGMGRAICRRLGSGKTLVVADVNQHTLDTVTDTLTAEGHQVQPFLLDVTCAESVREFARRASCLGKVTKVAHTSGLSPSQASAAQILNVDLLGVALVLDEFSQVIAPSGAGVVIASMAGHFLPPLSEEHRHAIASARPDELFTLPYLSPDTVSDPGWAYAVAKQAVFIRIRAAAPAWGRRNARINSISPGTIATPMGDEELASPLGDGIRAMIAAAICNRMGTAGDIASAAAFLLGPDAGYITGTDLLVDGGVTANMQTGSRQP